MTDRAVVAAYVAAGYRIITWPAIGDTKGPREEGWTTRKYTLADYQEGYRVGLMTGTEISPGKFSADVDIDWQPGSLIAQNLLPPTTFVFGRASKRVSHCFYTTDQPAVSFRYEDPIDKVCLIELRGTKSDGSIGMESMVPPSVWSKDGKREPLVALKFGEANHYTLAGLKRQVDYSAIGMLLAKHLGKNGFGHEPRLMWAGFLLRAGIPVEDLVKMGEAISVYCNNTEVVDVRRTVESTAARLADTKQKIKGGPSLAKHFGANGKKIISRINEWLGKDQDFIRADGKIIKDNAENIKRAVTALGHELSYDEFADKILLDKTKPIEDREMSDIWFRIDAEYKFRPTFQFFEKVIKNIGWGNSFHPVKEYLNGLTWDGTPRIDTWLINAAGAEDSLYLRAVNSIVLIAAVRRIREPGCKYDELLVLESSQGLNKSSALRALCPRGQWFSDDLPLNLNSQKMIEATLGKWIIEAADLAGKRKAEVEQLKANLSRQVDGPARLAYAHLPVERARQFIIIGTTNSAAYLTDPTGARRFWPVKVMLFDVAWIVNNRDQLWAEAAVREAKGESIRLKEELWPDAAKHQEERREIDPWEGPIRSVLISLEPGLQGKRRVCTSALWDVLGIETMKRDRYSSLRISEIMQRLGFERSRVRGATGDVEVGFVQANDALLLTDAEDESPARPKDDSPF